jgi:hypothetical protein
VSGVEERKSTLFQWVTCGSWYCLRYGSLNWLLINRCWSSSIYSLLGAIKKRGEIIVRIHNALKILGVGVCLIGAVVMIDGHIFGERTTGLATILSIMGISLISSSARKLRGR